MDSVKLIGETLKSETQNIVTLLKRCFKPALFLAKGSFILFQCLLNIVFGALSIVIGILGLPFGV